MQNLGVFGGTFDPPHIGHLILARYAYVELNLDKILFIPAGIQPHKQAKKISSPEDRFQMLRLAVRNDSRFDISRLEIDRGGLSYTSHTLRELHDLYPDAKLYFIMGGDNISDIDSWKNPEEIFALATVAAGRRPEYTSEGSFKNKITYFNMPQIEISSTMIRRLVGEGQPVRYLVPDEVEKYIMEKGLYIG